LEKKRINKKKLNGNENGEENDIHDKSHWREWTWMENEKSIVHEGRDDIMKYLKS